MNRKLVVFTILGVAMATTSVMAIDQTIDVMATMRVGLSFSNKIDMDFTPSSGHIDFYGTPTNADTVTMGTDGSLTANTSVFQPSANTGTPGSVDVTGDDTSAVDVTCSVSSTMAEVVSSTTIDVDQLQVSWNTGKAFATPDYTCLGVGNATTMAQTLAGGDKVILGGRLVGNSSIKTQPYSSANAGGTPATVRVVYH